MSARPDTATVHRSIAHLQRLTDLFQQRREQLAKRVGLTEQQWRVLEEVSSEHFMPSMFAKSQDSSAAAVSKVLRQLLDKDLVRVSLSQEDGRVRRYVLSAKGQRTMERLRADRQRAIEAIWADLPADELRRFHQLSGELIERIERYAASEADDQRPPKKPNNGKPKASANKRARADQ
jgi:DNA-binding MarR family transcriptional regulator